MNTDRCGCHAEWTTDSTTLQMQTWTSGQNVCPRVDDKFYDLHISVLEQVFTLLSLH